MIQCLKFTSDLHTVRSEWAGTIYPCVPGHEIVGRVTKVGPAVTKFKPGDIAAVGCMVDSDSACPNCKEGLEQFCLNTILTYNSPDKHPGGVTYGGYSDSIVVKEVVRENFLIANAKTSTNAAKVALADQLT